MNAYESGIKAYKVALDSKLILSDALLIVVDFTLSSAKKRLTVYENVLDNPNILDQTWVTHGSGTGDEYATKFSNITNSHQSSLGVFKTAETYIGKHGLSCKIDGLEKFNNKARSRAIVIHGADYIGDGKTGRSWGCFAVPQEESKWFIKLVKNGSLLVAYYPDKDWLNNSKFLKDV